MRFKFQVTVSVGYSALWHAGRTVKCIELCSREFEVNLFDMAWSASGKKGFPLFSTGFLVLLGSPHTIAKTVTQHCINPKSKLMYDNLMWNPFQPRTAQRSLFQESSVSLGSLFPLLELLRIHNPCLWRFNVSETQCTNQSGSGIGSDFISGINTCYLGYFLGKSLADLRSLHKVNLKEQTAVMNCSLNPAAQSIKDLFVTQVHLNHRFLSIIVM